MIADAALDRLRALRPGTPRRDDFTCDLSVDEFTLVHDAGYEPVGLVTGSCIYHIGLLPVMWSASAEMTVLSQAMYGARNLAMSRLAQDAQALDADGVVGVRLTIDHEAWGEHLAEFVAIGTAIRKRGSRQAPSWPFTSDLSGQDFWSLVRAGYLPTALVMGACVWHVPRQSLGGWLGQQGKNQELTNFTTAFYEARELAMARMQSEAARFKSEGVVGMRIEESSRAWGGHTIEFLALGTAIRATESGHRPIAHRLVVPLDR